MPSRSRFTFDGHEYQIKSSGIVAGIGDPYWCDTYNHGHGKTIAWTIGFTTTSHDDELPSPTVRFDGIQVDVKNWEDLVDYRAQWRSPINPETGDRYGLIYVYDHQTISNGRVEITARDGTKFHVVASGQNEEGQQFAIDANVEFKGIRVRGSERDSDESTHARLKQYIDDTNLTGTSFALDGEYESGVGMGESYYSPRNEPARSIGRED